MVVYQNLVMQNHFTSCVLQGSPLRLRNDRLRCVEFETGTLRWDQRGLGRGSLLIADGLLILLSERGELVLADVKPDVFTERARWKALQGVPCWTGPVLANGRLYRSS